MSHYAIVIEGDGSTNYSAYAPDLPGVVASGDTLEEVEAAMREAIEFHIVGLLPGDPVNRCHGPQVTSRSSSPSLRNVSVNHQRVSNTAADHIGKLDRQVGCPRHARGPRRPAASTGRSTEMIYIDLPADLNLEDDEGRNIARLADAESSGMSRQGAVLVAWIPHAWSWAVIEDVESGFVYFRQISARDAARRGSLIKPLPRSA